MALSTRTELLDAIADWLNRVNSPELIARAPDFITMTEARLNRDPQFRVRKMIKRATATLSSGYLALPGDFLEAKQVQVNLSTGKPRLLTQVTQDQADKYNSDTSITEPRHYVLIGDTLEVVPYTATALTVELAYYAKLPALTVAAPTNWLLTDWPDIYLYGSLVHSAPYLRDDERVATWATFYGTAVVEAKEADERSRFSGSVLKTRARLR
jgi:hypothetical protein